MKKWVLGVFLAGLAFAPAAEAGRVDLAKEVAGHVFSPACAKVSVVTGQLEDPSANGEAGNCVVYLNDKWRSWDADYLCSVVTHEYGHLAGLDHVSDPTNIMYGGYLGVSPLCSRVTRMQNRLADLREDTLPDLKEEAAYWRRRGAHRRAKRIRAKVTRCRRSIRRLRIALA